MEWDLDSEGGPTASIQLEFPDFTDGKMVEGVTEGEVEEGTLDPETDISASKQHGSP